MTWMARRQFLASTGALALCAAAQPAAAFAPATRWPLPPQPRREPRSVARFGPPRTDDYGWMRPKDWLAVLRDPASLDAPIMAAVRAENAYADAMLAPAAGLRDQLAARAQALEAHAAPLEVRYGAHLYYQRSVAGQDQPVHARRPAGGGAEELLLDVKAEAGGNAVYKLHWDGPQYSRDGRLIGWSADPTGAGIFAIRVRDIATGRLIVSDIDAGHGSFAFDAGGRYLFWVGRAAKGNANAVWRRDMTTGRDVKILAEEGDAFFIALRASASGAFVFIDFLNGDVTECRMIAAAAPTAEPMMVEPRLIGHSYFVDHWNDRLVIRTDADGASDYKLMTAPVATPGRAHWREWVPHQKGRLIAAIHPFKDKLVREEWRDAKPRLVVMDRAGKEQDADFGDPAYALAVPAGQGWDAAALAFTYQSPTRPPLACRLDLASGVASPARAAAPTPNFDPRRYRLERIEAVAADGERIPITLLTAADAKRDGQRPLLLYGYGSYGANVPADFSPAAIALVEQGFTYAIAHVRGGAEKGSYWWRSVLKRGKKTSFTDFITCAEHLIAERYTAKGRIVAHGYSAGGLLMGAVYTMRPDLWAGVIAQVPFVDVLNSIEAFESHPLGTTSFAFWGDPRVPEDHAYMASYSPYDRLQPADYPALLATGSIADPAVSFWEPLKFAARARHLTTAGHPIMARIALTGGHVPPVGSAAERDQFASFHAFAIWAAADKWGAVPQRA